MLLQRLSQGLAKGKPSLTVSRLFQHGQERAAFAIFKLRALQHSAASANDAHSKSTPPSSKPGHLPGNPSLPSFNLLLLLREAHPAVRYTVYVGLGLLAVAETTFWVNVLRAKFFPQASEADRQRDNELLDRLNSAIAGYRKVWLSNYQKYYAAHIWGLGYGGLDGLRDGSS